MNIYHGTTLRTWRKAQRNGFLEYVEPGHSWWSTDIKEAAKYGEVLIVRKLDPSLELDVRQYGGIPISRMSLVEKS